MFHIINLLDLVRLKNTIKKQLKNALFTIHHLIRRALYCAWYARVSPVMYNGNKIMQFDLLIYIICYFFSTYLGV